MKTYLEISKYVSAALAIFISAELCQYIYIAWDTHPALLLPATGIALAFVWNGGYRYLCAVAVGFFLAEVWNGMDAQLPYFVAVVQAVQILTVAAAAALLHHFKFDGTFISIRDVILFLVVVVITSAIAPAIAAGIGYYLGFLAGPAYVYFSSAWAGSVFSCVILTPALIAWLLPEPPMFKQSSFEAGFVSTLLVITVYVFFWTDVLPQYSFLFFTTFFLAHFWACLRLSHRIVMLSISTTAFLSIVGLLVSPQPGITFGTQLFTLQLFLLAAVPIFYAFSALVKERMYTIVELQRVNNAIAHESVMKNEFIAVMAHELRNPLAPVRTTLEILEMETEDPETKKTIASALQQVHSMRRLLDDLLDITRVTQGKFQLQLELVSLRDIVDRAIHSTQALYAKRRHELSRNPEAEGTVYLNVDPVRFEQVVVNLLNNAAKYTDPGGVVEIRTEVLDDRLSLQVSDNGQGILPEHTQHIFESFWQKNSEARVGNGIGVGLSLTKRIIELHKGTIEVASAGPGLGTTFTVSIPVARVSHPAAQVVSLSKGSPARCKLLIVDDNKDAADSLAKLLALKGHHTHAVYSVEEVEEAVRDHRPEVILLDIGLPGKSGYEVAAELRAGGYKGLLLALSGYGQKEDKEKALKAGFDQHFTKPMATPLFEEYLALALVANRPL